MKSYLLKMLTPEELALWIDLKVRAARDEISLHEAIIRAIREWTRKGEGK